MASEEIIKFVQDRMKAGESILQIYNKYPRVKFLYRTKEMPEFNTFIEREYSKYINQPEVAAERAKRVGYAKDPETGKYYSIKKRRDKEFQKKFAEVKREHKPETYEQYAARQRGLTPPTGRDAVRGALVQR